MIKTGPFFLVLTADETTWPKDENESILFLGDWCKTFKRKDALKDRSFQTLSYHWDDRKKMDSDYQYLEGVYERTLISLSHKLNEIHKTNHTINYWRILIGPWLGCFIHIVFDRWSSISKAIDVYEINEVAVYNNEQVLSLIPFDTLNFFHLLTYDEWNHNLGILILRNLANKLNYLQIESNKVFNGSIKSEKRIKIILKEILKKGIDVYNSILLLFQKKKYIF